jgi:hypothetical protein
MTGLTNSSVHVRGSVDPHIIQVSAEKMMMYVSEQIQSIVRAE